VPTLLIQDIQVNYQAIGRGPLVLCLHGWASSLRMWQRTSKQLASRYKVISLDLPGFGDSSLPGPGFDFTAENYAAVVSAFLAQVASAPAVMLGHSMGGLIAIYAALHHPDQVSGLVLSNPVITGNIGPGLSAFLRSRMGQRVLRLSEHSRLLAPLGQRAIRADPRFFRGPALQRTITDLARSAPEALSGCLRTILEGDVSSRLADIEMPTLVITGAHDRTIPVADARLAAQRIRGAHLSIVPRASHLPMDEQPILFDRLVESYLTRYAPRTKLGAAA
jgi:pimeloyl-ACP methyl ester carboxylesterase